MRPHATATNIPKEMKVQKMNKEKNQLVEQSPAQSDTNLCNPRDFEVIEAGEAPTMRTPFHNQCGKTDAEYQRLLRQGEEAANASDFNDDGELRPDVNRSGKPRTP
jgi:hypothetical protein